VGKRRGLREGAQMAQESILADAQHTTRYALGSSRECRRSTFLVLSAGGKIVVSAAIPPSMPTSLDQFVRRLVRSRLASAEEAKALLTEARREHPNLTVQRFATALVRSGRLSKYQACAIYRGEVNHLVLGNYVVLERIGAGGMGLVYKGRHQRMKRLVALKVLPPEAMKTSESVARFQREVEAAAQLSHPHIVTAHDADEDRGIHFLVMEYVDGRDLAPRSEHDVLPPKLAANYILQAARGLEYAHNRGLVHRDIKPSNLLVDSHGMVKILDMGLARFDQAAREDGATEELPITRAGEIMGTVDYMAPEQAEDFRNADARSDIYALGCTMHCLMFARPPYHADTMLRKLLAHREAAIPSLRQRNPEIDEELDRIFQKMIAKRPEDRFQTASEVILALEAWGAAEVAQRDEQDPYVDWLGAPPDSLPPNDYELLGVPIFEDDQARIRIGYQRQLAKVRQHLDGPRRAEAQRLIDELAQAHQRLADAGQKETYDDDLLGVTGGEVESEMVLRTRRRPDTVGDAPSTWTHIPAPSSDVAPSQLIEDDEEEYQLKDLPEDEEPKPKPLIAPPTTAAEASKSMVSRRKVVCPCGQKLAVRSDLAGKKIRCPKCQRLLSIPARVAVAPKPLKVTCRCGQQYHARADLAGKTVKCLRCGASLSVPKVG
jgi:serine/threonine protein kinase